MTFFCLSVCFIGVLLVGDVFPWNWNEEEPLSEVFEIDSHDTDEESTEDYPQYFFHIDEGIFNTEENEVNIGEKRPKPDVETAMDEDVPGTGSSDTEPLPDPDTSNLDILAEKVDKLISDFKTQQDKIAELEAANQKLILKIDWIEQQTKTNSIILYNVHQDQIESSKKTLQRVLHVFNKLMRVRISASDISVALRAESNTSNRNKPIVVRFTNFATKMRVLAASNRLSHTDMTVSSDYSELVAQRRAALLPYLQEARAEGSRAFLLYDKLVVDGVSYTLEGLMANKEQVEMLDVEP